MQVRTLLCRNTHNADISAMPVIGDVACAATDLFEFFGMQVFQEDEFLDSAKYTPELPTGKFF